MRKACKHADKGSMLALHTPLISQASFLYMKLIHMCHLENKTAGLRSQGRQKAEENIVLRKVPELDNLNETSMICIQARVLLNAPEVHQSRTRHQMVLKLPEAAGPCKNPTGCCTDAGAGLNPELAQRDSLISVCMCTCQMKSRRAKAAQLKQG